MRTLTCSSSCYLNDYDPHDSCHTKIDMINPSTTNPELSLLLAQISCVSGAVIRQETRKPCWQSNSIRLSSMQSLIRLVQGRMTARRNKWRFNYVRERNTHLPSLAHSRIRISLFFSATQTVEILTQLPVGVLNLINPF